MHSHLHFYCTRSTALQGLAVLEPVRQADEAPVLDSCEGIVGRSPALLGALRAVSQVAPTQATVLITGESGTGKELIARAIHRNSRRRDGPLVKVNCAAVPAALIESEFFGHERGAFTGATGRREGRFMLADGGTIFLDEVGELALELQAKLLRVLQEGEFEPVGTSRTRRVNVRVVAATNRDLQGEVRAGRFREDLFYRLDVFPVHLPPLRDRPGDIPLLVAAFVDRLSRQLQRRFAPPSRDCLRQLQAYDWPGNVRELHNVVERAVITARGDALDLAGALPQPEELQAVVERAPSAARRVLTVRELHQIERDNLLLALEVAGWRVSGPGGAAELLGINASTLSSRIKALRIERQRHPTRSAGRSNARRMEEARYV
jgi:transcriptional regulator with GAF, ATPase, and Fis domain